MKPAVRVVIGVAVAAAAGLIFAAKQASPVSDPVATPPTPVTQTAGVPKIVCLGAGKCIPCKQMEPVREALRNQYAGRLGVEFYDVWKDPAVGQKYKIHVIPTTIFYDAAGKELDRAEGFMGKEDILARFEAHGVKVKG
jgi:thioredoxin 1